MTIIKDDNFAIQPKFYHDELVRSLRNLQETRQLNIIRVMLLIKIPFEEDVFYSEFLEKVIEDDISEKTALLLYKKIVDQRIYPFYEVGFMVWILKNLHFETFK